MVYKSQFVLLFFFIKLSCYAQYKELGYLASCDSINKMEGKRSIIYINHGKLRICTGIGFKINTIDTVIETQHQSVNVFISCDTCDMQCDKGNFFFVRKENYIEINYLNSSGKKSYVKKWITLIRNVKTPYVGLFPRPEDGDKDFNIKGNSIYLKDTVVNDGINNRHACFQFFVKYKEQQHQTVYSQNLFIDKSSLLPIRVEDFNYENNMIDCSKFYPSKK